MTDQFVDAARAILRGNDRGGYTVPNGRVYPFQWNWDSAFVALGFDTFDRERAWTEVETLFSAQWADGFVPHIVFWQDDEGYFPGPAVWATGTHAADIGHHPAAGRGDRCAAVVGQSAVAAGQGDAFRPRAEALFDQLLAWHRWFADVRDPDRRGVVVAMHPWETGRDNSPEWDVPGEPIDVSDVGEYVRRDTGHLDAKMRPTKLEYDRYLALVQHGRAAGWDHARIAATSPFKVADIGMSMILLRANRDLLALAEMLGRDGSRDRELDRARRGGIGWLWDDARGKLVLARSADRPAFGLRHQRVVPQLLRRARRRGEGCRDARAISTASRAACAYLMPSLDPDDPGFQMVRYWRGPVWAVVNWMIGTGLAEAGDADGRRGPARHARPDAQQRLLRSVQPGRWQRQRRRRFLLDRGDLAGLVGMTARGLRAVAAAALMLSVGAVSLPHPVCDARSYGAKGDSATLDTGAIQRAIDACARAGGGRVILAGDTFLSGTLVLKDHVTLVVARAATLLASPRIADYRPFPPEDIGKIAVDGSTQSKGNRPFHLIHAENAVDVAIEGGGTIVGNGAAFWDSGTDGAPVSRRARPSPLIEFVATRGIRVEDLTIRDAPGWTIHPLELSDIKIGRVAIRNDPKGPNTDAIDIDSSRNVVVSDADIVAGDDCVVLKTTGRRPGRPVPPTENVRVTRIRCSSDDQGIKIGTESLGDFRNIEISDVLIYRAPGMYRPPTAGISMSMVDGAAFDDVRVHNIVIRNTATPLFLRLCNRGRGQVAPVTGTLTNVVFSNIRASGGTLASSITGLPGHPLRGVTLRDVLITMAGGESKPFAGLVAEAAGDYPHAPMFGALPASVLYVRHVDGLTLINVRLRVVAPDVRPPLALDDVRVAVGR